LRSPCGVNSFQPDEHGEKAPIKKKVVTENQVSIAMALVVGRQQPGL